MPALDSFVGDGLAPSPYKEALARAERAEAERDALRTLTPAMMDAAFAAVQPTSGREWFRAMYNAAIDAARKEWE